MVNLWESLICVAVIPGAFAGGAITIAQEHWDVSWWVIMGVGIVGYLVGFIVAAIGGTIIERITKKRKSCGY